MESNVPKNKNLLILGAGGLGIMVKEVATSIGEFERIEFLDDESDKAIGKIADLCKFKTEFSNVFVAIGDLILREKLQNELKDFGYDVPVLVHPEAYVSSSAAIGQGSVILAKAIIESNSQIGEGCIISSGAIVDHDSIINDYCHINSGAIVSSATEVPTKTKLDYGKLFK